LQSRSVARSNRPALIPTPRSCCRFDGTCQQATAYVFQEAYLPCPSDFWVVFKVDLDGFLRHRSVCGQAAAGARLWADIGNGRNQSNWNGQQEDHPSKSLGEIGRQSHAGRYRKHKLSGHEKLFSPSIKKAYRFNHPDASGIQQCEEQIVACENKEHRKQSSQAPEAIPIRPGIDFPDCPNC
jgi:hypothetical protein